MDQVFSVEKVFIGEGLPQTSYGAASPEFQITDRVKENDQNNPCGDCTTAVPENLHPGW